METQTDRNLRKTTVIVRRLATDDTDALRSLRLRALSESPRAFASTHEAEAAWTDDDWTRWIQGGATFVIEDGAGKPVGLATGFPHRSRPDVVSVVSVWVVPEHRGSSAAQMLLDAVDGWARSVGAHSLALFVETGNARAAAFYRRMGFHGTGREWYRERDGCCEIEMTRGLDQGPRGPEPT